MLRRQLGPAQPVKNHHRTGNSGSAQFVECRQRRLVSFALVHVRQYLVIAGFCADVGNFQPGIGQFVQFFDRLLAQISR